MNDSQVMRRPAAISNFLLPARRRFTKGGRRSPWRAIRGAVALGCLGWCAPVQAQQGAGGASEAAGAKAVPTGRGTWMKHDGSIIFGTRSDGVLIGGAWTISEGGLFAGFGELKVLRLLNQGRTEPGFVRLTGASRWPNSIGSNRDLTGTLTVTGDFQQDAKGTLVIDVRSPRRHDVLRVNGTAKLSGTLRVNWRGYRPKAGDRIPILNARKIVGQFTRIRTSLPGRYTVEFKTVGGLGILVVGESFPPGRYVPPPCPARGPRCLNF